MPRNGGGRRAVKKEEEVEPEKPLEIIVENFYDHIKEPKIKRLDDFVKTSFKRTLFVEGDESEIEDSNTSDLEDESEEIEDEINAPTDYSYQIPHVANNIAKLAYFPGLLDSSDAGLGKTRMALRVAKGLNLPVVVVAERNLHPHWEREAKVEEVTILDMVTYTSMSRSQRSEKGVIWATPHKEDKYRYYLATEEFEGLVKDGILLILDEVSKLKNDNKTSRAVLSLPRVVAKNYYHNPQKEERKSRIMALSALPGEKENTAFNLVRLLGITDKHRIHTGEEGKYFKESFELGSLDVKAFARRICEANEKDFYEEYKYPMTTKATISKMVIDLYLNVIAPEVTVHASNPGQKVNRRIYNGFFETSASKEILDILTKLAREAFIEKDGKLVLDPNNRDMFTAGLKKVELLKIGIFHRRSMAWLNANKNNKVIIFLNYIENMQVLVELLEKEGITSMILAGQEGINEKKYRVTHNTRDRRIHLFNLPDSDFRVIICHPRVASQGINLGDTDGRFKRMTLLSPSYFFSDQYQASNRSHRTNSRSDSLIYIVYVEDCELEQKLLKSAIPKGKCGKQLAQREDAIYPNEYEKAKFVLAT